MKRYVKFLGALCLLLLCMLPVRAENADTYINEQLEESGANDLWNSLSEETKALYDAIGIENITDLGNSVLSPDALFEAAGETIAQQGKTPFSILGILLCTIVLCAYLGGLKDTVGGGDVHNVYQSVSVLAICGVTVLPFVACIKAVRSALSGAAVFMGSFSPVYIAVLSASGQLRAALSYQTVLLLFSQLLTWLANGVLLPLLLTAFALGMVSSAADAGNLSKISEMLLKTVTWAVGILAAVFTTLLTVNGMLGAAGDTLSSRMVKLSLSSFVPVVGGALSEAFLTVKGCIGVVRTTVGAFGMITTALLLLPTLIQCGCWQLCLWGAGTAADVFEQKTLAAFLKTMQQVTKTMVALLAVCALFMIIGTAVVARGAAS